jgi:hypothetical protein
VIGFEVSDGHAVARRTFVFHVHPNRAPTNTPSDQPLVVAVRDDGSSSLASDAEAPIVVAWDPDDDELTFRARELPPGARLAAADGRVTLQWNPTEADLGAHDVVVDVSDGTLTRTLRVKVLVIADWAQREHTGWLLLGGGASAFVTPRSGESLLGGALDLSLVALRESAARAYGCGQGVRTHDCHASYHRFYAQLEVLDSLRRGAPSVFTYAVGYSASLEWYPGRRYLIPHYGIELGGLVREGHGHLAQTRPYLGLHLWASDALWINAAAGYRVVPAALSELSGPTFALTLVSNPW